MKHELLIREIFPLENGITVLACDGELPADALVGEKASLISDRGVRQEIVLSGERQMLNQSENQRQHVIETEHVVDLTVEEARSGLWRLVWGSSDRAV